MKQIISLLCAASAAIVVGCGSDSSATAPITGTGGADATLSNLGTMNVGDVRVLTFPQASAGLAIPASLATAQYAVILSNVNVKSSANATYGVHADWLAPEPSASAELLNFPMSQQVVPAMHPNLAFEGRLREIERTQLPKPGAPGPHAAADRAMITGPKSVNAPPAVGTSLSIKVLTPNGFNNVGSGACAATGAYTTTTGVVRYNSVHATVVADVNAPSGGFTDADYKSVGDEFDSLIYPTDVGYYGTPTDLDNNGHIIIYYTPAVNQLTKANAASTSGYVGGFFFAGDLYDATAAGCLSSNKGEIFYLLAPDPNKVYGNSFPTSFVRRVTRGTVAHEFQHMINSGNRYVSGYNFEATWLDEGLAHFAEDAVGRAEAGYTDNVKVTNAAINALDNDTYEAFFAQNFSRAKYYVSRPDTIGAITSDAKAASDLSARGASWAMLRYGADWFNTNGDPRTFTKKLAAGPDTGVTNLVAAAAVPIDTLLSRWLVTMYTDNQGIQNLPAAYNYKSYALRDIITATQIGSNSNPSYLPVVAIGSGMATLSATFPPSSAAYFLTSQTTGAARTVTISSSDANGRVYVVRTQ